MTQPCQQRWCHACRKMEDFDTSWFELWIDIHGNCTIQRVIANYEPQFEEDIYACGQMTALVLVERFLHTGTFDPPVPATPTPAPEPFDTLT